MSTLHLALPLRIREVAEAFSVEDANERSAAYVYFERGPGQPNRPPRYTKDQAREIAQAIARALTNQVEDEAPGAGG